jgi:hypothetical protein
MVKKRAVKISEGTSTSDELVLVKTTVKVEPLLLKVADAARLPEEPVKVIGVAKALTAIRRNKSMQQANKVFFMGDPPLKYTKVDT